MYTKAIAHLKYPEGINVSTNENCDNVIVAKGKTLVKRTRK